MCSCVGEWGCVDVLEREDVFMCGKVRMCSCLEREGG